MTGEGERSIGYQPALDGLRAVAVVLVLLFHLDLGWMSGGYLGVSVFFTLSGFLITTLLVTELNRTGDVALRRFYGRRARRLLPASMVCLAGASILIAARLVPDRSGLRWYIFGGLFQFANWVPLGLQDSYGELFNALSPTDHFWSLAIEEQFYWIWPVTLLGLFRLIQRRNHGHGAVDNGFAWTGSLMRILTVMFLLFGISAPLTAQLWNGDAAYFATWARVPEILAGAVLAVAVIRHRLPGWATVLAPVGLVVVIALSVVTPAVGGFAYEGALPLFALVSAGLIAGLQQPSLVSRMLSLHPLVFLGKISYGVYLYHWPVFVVLTSGRTGLSQWPLGLLRIAVTLAIALVSYFLIEMPIRERRMLSRPGIALVATGLAIPMIVLLGITQVSNVSTFESTGDTLAPVVGDIAPLVAADPDDTTTATSTATSTTAPMPPSTATTDTTNASATTDAAIVAVSPTTVSTAVTTTVQLVPPRPVRILVVGDSTALATGVGLTNWANEHPELAEVEVQGFGGCGVLTKGERLFQGAWLPESAGCVELILSKVPRRIAEGKPDIVVVISSFWDVTDHRLGDDSTPLSVLSPGYRNVILQTYTAYNQILLDAGAPRVAWALYPATDYEWQAEQEPADDPARFEAFYEVERLAAAPYPGQVTTIDFAAWSDSMGLSLDRDARPDGVHWTPEVATDIATEWLGNAIIQVALH